MNALRGKVSLLGQLDPRSLMTLEPSCFQRIMVPKKHPSMGLNVLAHYGSTRPVASRERKGLCKARVEQSRDPSAKVAYQEMVRAWIMLAECAEQMANAKPFIRSDLAA